MLYLTTMMEENYMTLCYIKREEKSLFFHALEFGKLSLSIINADLTPQV